ncbi:uncharacterized protein At2g29880-like [Nymphaea colorata]|uniref:uncharacterized protein At2g29880-like n=1 Tax=Nymphaea colorata TaxID=210225 RepID=UPI00129DA682|nr:uncharacterized protein At2g29880-like [Nymphaea colorata]
MKVVEQKMIEAYGPMFTLEKIRKKLKRAKPDLQLMKEMLTASGFGWDPDKKMIQADDNVWKEYTQKYPNRKKYKLSATWKYYEHAIEIWGSSTALGDNRSGVDSRPLDDIQINVDEQDENDFQLPTSPMDSNTHTQGETSNSMRGNKRARTSTTMNDDTFETIGEYIRQLVETQPAAILQKSGAILRDMHAKGEIDNHLFFRSVDLLSNFDKANVFLMMPRELQVTWLRMQIG